MAGTNHMAYRDITMQTSIPTTNEEASSSSGWLGPFHLAMRDSRFMGLMDTELQSPDSRCVCVCVRVAAERYTKPISDGILTEVPTACRCVFEVDRPSSCYCLFCSHISTKTSKCIEFNTIF